MQGSLPQLLLVPSRINKINVAFEYLAFNIVLFNNNHILYDMSHLYQQMFDNISFDTDYFFWRLILSLDTEFVFGDS